MKKVTFKFRDQWSNGRWVTRNAICESVEKCIEFFGLGIDCEYEILKVEPATNEEAIWSVG